MAERYADGAVALAIYAEEARGAGWPEAIGGLAFDLLLTAEQAVQNVPAILGIWYPTSDNYSVFKAQRDARRSAGDAALATFTGTKAARHGYGEVVHVEEDGHAVGVRFERGGPRQ